MLHVLERHPFGIEAFFRRSLVLTYAMPKTILAALVGPGLEIDVYGEWGFLAIALVQTESLRPRGFPTDDWCQRRLSIDGLVRRARVALNVSLAHV